LTGLQVSLISLQSQVLKLTYVGTLLKLL